MKKKIKLINKTKNIKISLITCDDDYSVNEMGYMLEFENVTTHKIKRLLITEYIKEITGSAQKKGKNLPMFYT